MKWKDVSRSSSGVKFEYHPDICLGGCWGKLQKNLSQYSLIWSKFEPETPQMQVTTVTAFINDEISLWQHCSTAWCRHQLFHWKLLQELGSNCLNACLSGAELRHLRLFVIHLHVFTNVGCRQWCRTRGARWCITFLHQSLYINNSWN